MVQMTVKQYADSLGKSRHTIYLWIREQRLPKGVSVKEIAGHKIIHSK
jgi:predicted DNA-binding transcriptional regulator AlpA